MSYNVPTNPPLLKRWPHLYSLLSLVFHGWILWRGFVITQRLALNGYSFSDWFGDQQFLCIASGFLVLACLLSLARRTRAGEIVILNASYSLLIIFSLLMHVSLLGDGASINELFVNLGGLMMGLVLVNAVYTLFRYLTRHEL
jgi:hypothetical protein